MEFEVKLSKIGSLALAVIVTASAVKEFSKMANRFIEYVENSKENKKVE